LIGLERVVSENAALRQRITQMENESRNLKDTLEQMQRLMTEHFRLCPQQHAQQQIFLAQAAEFSSFNSSRNQVSSPPAASNPVLHLPLRPASAVAQQNAVQPPQETVMSFGASQREDPTFSGLDGKD